MNNIKGLNEYLKRNSFKDALNIPNNLDIECSKLAQGEYNINYLLIHPVSSKKMVLRLNAGSQMHLDSQIEYEYNALDFLKDSKRTPKPIFLDGSKEHLEFGLLVMEFLEGRSLNYKTDLKIAAESLADIHSILAIENKNLLSPENPLQAILNECTEMFEIYLNSDLGSRGIKKKISKLLKLGEKKLIDQGIYKGYRCCINTELNSGNFLIDDFNKYGYIIDWEKPLYGNPVQDLGHFLAPTTTFWKTDIILNDDEEKEFIKHYLNSVSNKFIIEDLYGNLELFIAITCLRGITWCSMAWVEYIKNKKTIQNKNTFMKLESYLKTNFLDMIEKKYFK